MRCFKGGEILTQDNHPENIDINNEINEDCDKGSNQLSVGPKYFSQNVNKENDKNGQNINGTTTLTIEALNEFNLQMMKNTGTKDMTMNNNQSENEM